MQSFRIIQVPSKENNSIAIVEYEKTTADGTFSDFGIATKKSENTEEVEILLDKAREKAKNNLQNMCACTITHEAENRSNIHQSRAQESSDQPKQYNHSTNKPISEKQTELIIKLTNSQDNADKLANQQYNKHLHALNSKEANDIIPSRRNRKHPYYRIYVGNYTVFYVVTDDIVEMCRLLYSPRNHSNFLEQ